MKMFQHIDNSLIKCYKNKSLQIGGVTVLADNKFSFDKNKTNFTIAIIGVGTKITEKSFLKIRKDFYDLYLNSKGIRILDLGNVEFDEKNIKKIIADLNSKEINTVFLCETDETSATILHLQQSKKSNTVLILPNITSTNKHIAKLSENKISIIGYQNYFSDKNLVDKLNKNSCKTMRLSEYRAEPSRVEPVLRDSDFLAIDFASVKSSDGGTANSPNGLYAEEICAIANYAGLSNKISQMNIVCKKNINAVSSQLTAQAIWHFLDGLSNRIVESPKKNKLKKFIVDMGNSSSNLVFYKSEITNRWWLEVEKKGKIEVIPCSFSDYKMACDKDVPMCWIQEIQK